MELDLGEEAGAHSNNMRLTTRIYVASIAIVTIVAIAAMAYISPTVSRTELTAVAFLSALAVGAEMLAFVLSRKTRGSIAFIPYLAAVLIVPSWVAVVSVIIVKLAMEGFARIDWFKAAFNAFTHGITLACAIGVYTALGGRSLLELSNAGIGGTTAEFGVPALFAFMTSFCVNMLLVGGVIALDSDERLSTIIRRGTSTIGADLLATPIVFVFAWLYSSFGAMAAAVAWVPIVGIRHVNRVQLELEETNQELLQLMVKAIEARDPYTSGHSRRVSKFAAAIARALGLSQRDIDNVATAALLHDVGKIYEKYAPILRNPGRLTPAEWATMQEHPVDGANLVGTISRLQGLVPAVRHHHENWDGTGYPDNLAGKNIPRASRIIMFADTIDAMTSERPYRGALTETEVRSEIVKCRGKQFDPEIADRLLAAGVWHTLFGRPKNQTGNRKLELVAERETA